MKRRRLRYGVRAGLVAGLSVVTGLSACVLPTRPAAARSHVRCNDIPALKAAVRQANNTGAPILLAPRCTYRLTTADHGEDGLPPITGNVRISSSYAAITRSSAAAFRIMHVAPAGRLTLVRTALGGGLASSGGAIANDRGTVTLIDVTVEKSRAHRYGGGISNKGGAITMRRGALRDNTAGSDGGGMENQSAAVATLIGTTITGNTGGEWGGGIDNWGGSALSLIDARLGGNRAVRGGGLSNYDSTATLLGGSVTGNTAISGAGGGGGVFRHSGTVDVTSGVVTGNTPDDCTPTGGVTGCAAAPGANAGSRPR